MSRVEVFESIKNEGIRSAASVGTNATIGWGGDSKN
jgi:hypothetical protein